MSSMNTGVVKFYDRQRGFGFITPSAGGADIFVHFTGLCDRGAYPPDAGDAVTYKIGSGRRGRKAIQVRTVAVAAGAVAPVSGGRAVTESVAGSCPCAGEPVVGESTVPADSVAPGALRQGRSR
ncbi:cold-shock protein [Nocardia miyunensis]|uniref:cold-shock protein n=1 Tax=Nocardia miyunensis TaxID=282684 RepID=UPI000833E826|nr:cold shock domain-containing protein [Nocardia miyunensis]